MINLFNDLRALNTFVEKPTSEIMALFCSSLALKMFIDTPTPTPTHARGCSLLHREAGKPSTPQMDRGAFITTFRRKDKPKTPRPGRKKNHNIKTQNEPLLLSTTFLTPDSCASE